MNYIVGGLRKKEGVYSFMPSNKLKKLENKEPLSDVLGLTYREGENVIQNSPRERMEDIDTLPLPARHLLPMEKYLDATKRNDFVMRQPALAMLTSRGCPQKCVFCGFCSKTFSRRNFSVRLF